MPNSHRELYLNQNRPFSHENPSRVGGANTGTSGASSNTEL